MVGAGVIANLESSTREGGRAVRLCDETLIFLLTLQQNVPEDSGLVMRLVTRCINKRNPTFPRQIAQPVEFTSMSVKLRCIASLELIPTGWLVPEPFSQRRARC
jgi:hypothetical protein